MKRPFILLSLALAAIGMNAQTRLFHTGDHTGYPYRIPAIATAVNGDVIALSDLRPCGGDIGYGRVGQRSDERRVGNASRSRWAP